MTESQQASGHTPVSNQPEHPDFPKVTSRIESAPPESGDDAELVRGTPDGRESVPQLESFFETPREWIAPDTSGLPDIGVASFGEPPAILEAVHGVDDRVRIDNADEYPWRANASLLITARDGSRSVGTAFFISSRTLVTAGHCVFVKKGQPERDGWVKSIQVMPGRDGRRLPYGSATSTDFRTVRSWAEDGDEDFDYGAIILPTALGDRVGTMGYGVYTDSDLEATVGNIAGYPSDKPGSQWYDSRTVANVTNRKVYYDIDTHGGQSGSAVYHIRDGKRYAFAIHAYGGGQVNSGTRINAMVYENLEQWKV